MATVGRLIRDSLTTCLASTAGSEYIILKYLDNLEKNSFTQGKDKRYGVRPGATPETEEVGVTKSVTYTQTFQFVLTKEFCNDGVSDTAQYEAFMDLHEIALRFINKVIAARSGLQARVVHAKDAVIDEPQFIEDSVAVLTGNIDIVYRLIL